MNLVPLTPSREFGVRTFIAATDEVIRVDCARKAVTLTTDAGVYVRSIPYAIQAPEVVEDANGTEHELVSARWLPIPPNSVNANNIRFSDPSGAGWGTLVLGVTGRLGYRQ